MSSDPSQDHRARFTRVVIALRKVLVPGRINDHARFTQEPGDRLQGGMTQDVLEYRIQGEAATVQHLSHLADAGLEFEAAQHPVVLPQPDRKVGAAVVADLPGICDEKWNGEKSMIRVEIPQGMYFDIGCRSVPQQHANDLEAAIRSLRLADERVLSPQRLAWAPTGS